MYFNYLYFNYFTTLVTHCLITLHASEAVAQCIVITPVCLFVGLLP